MQGIINRLPSADLKTLSAAKKLRLPFPCLSMMGVEIVNMYDLRNCRNERIIPDRRYTDRFDPKEVLLYWPYNAEGLFEQEVLLPTNVVQLRSMGKIANDLTDHLSNAARDLVTAILDYMSKFQVVTEKNGQKIMVDKPITTERQEAYAKILRGNVQKTFLIYQLRQLHELKRLIRENVFKTTHPGCFAPILPDPVLDINEVRIPIEIWSAFEGRHAMVIRHPVLNTVYRMRPVKGSDMAIMLNPLLFDRIGADCDGDTVFVTPLPASLDGGAINITEDMLVYDEANVLLKDLPLDDRQNLPADIPPLSLTDYGSESNFRYIIKRYGIRNFSNAVLEPMDDETYYKESLAAAARFQWEKQAIGKADCIRRSLLVMTDDPDTLRSINEFCSVVTQLAIDAGKHRSNFPLDEYMMAFNGQYRQPTGEGGYTTKTFTSVDQMAHVLTQIANLPDMLPHTTKIAELMFSFPEFLTIGRQGLINKYFPWWGLVSQKSNTIPQTPDKLKDLDSLLNLDTSLDSQANLYW